MKAVLPNNGTFEVKYEGGKAVLKWPKPAGDYTRQVIEQWTNNRRKRRAAETKCKKNSECTEHEVEKEQTSLTITVEHQDYTFKLVLYDGDVLVSEFPSKVVPDPTKSKFYLKASFNNQPKFYVLIFRFSL